MKRSYIAPYFVGLLVLVLGDIAWVGYLMSGFYQNHLFAIMAPSINVPGAILFYLSYSFGIFFFATKPALKERSIRNAALYGALLGFVAYGTYDFTNQATLLGWSFIVTIVDVLWGMALTAAAATIAVAVTQK